MVKHGGYDFVMAHICREKAILERIGAQNQRRKKEQRPVVRRINSSGKETVWGHRGTISAAKTVKGHNETMG